MINHIAQRLFKINQFHLGFNSLIIARFIQNLIYMPSGLTFIAD